MPNATKGLRGRSDRGWEGPTVSCEPGFCVGSRSSLPWLKASRHGIMDDRRPGGALTQGTGLYLAGALTCPKEATCHRRVIGQNAGTNEARSSAKTDPEMVHTMAGCGAHGMAQGNSTCLFSGLQDDLAGAVA